MATVGGQTATQALPVLQESEPLLPEQDPERQQPRRAGLWVLLGLLLAALVAVLLLVLPGALNRPPAVQRVAVPDVVGRTLTEAQAAITRAGLKVGSPTERPSDTVADGSVISVDPTQGVQVPRGTQVELVVSTGPFTVDVPELAGRTQKEAQQALQDAGLELGDVSRVESIDRAKGEVVSSDPAPGDAVAPGTKVDVEVASGKVTVPNVVGLSLVDATAKLTESKLTVDGTTYRDSTQPPNTVIDQTNQGKSVNQGTRIKLVIAREPAPPTPTTPTTTPAQTPSSSPTTTPDGSPSSSASPSSRPKGTTATTGPGPG
jgi:serine/threonine-protein kinase